MSRAVKLSIIAVQILGFNSLIFSQTGQSLYTQGWNLFLQGNFREATLLLETSYENEPENREQTLLLLVKSSILLGDQEKAGLFLNRFLSEHNDSPMLGSALYYSARLSFLRNNFEASAIGFNDFLQHFQDEYYTPLSYFWMARSFMELQLLNEARQILIVFQSYYPNHPLAEEASRSLAEINNLLHPGSN